ncbi:hypothetical protein [Lysobacter capsici]|uniref:hypothetical protein n=1 Tax=Lysobacter capsici TaxID=435897 RepID=UPI001C004FF3|nr:hypothetical protein [Lysobacter capsici]QWF14929.1 hypothetical protein KME82_14025 [Lysobacter capsici]
MKLEAGSKASATKAAGYFLLSKATKVRLDSLRSKGNQRKTLFLNQVTASAELAQACATRDIHVPVAHGVHPARRPPGVLLFSRVRCFAALEVMNEKGLKTEQLGLCFSPLWKRGAGGICSLSQARANPPALRLMHRNEVAQGACPFFTVGSGLRACFGSIPDHDSMLRALAVPPL